LHDCRQPAHPCATFNIDAGATLRQKNIRTPCIDPPPKALLECRLRGRRCMPMYLIWTVMAAVLLAGIILFLHKSQQQNRREVAERSAPLAGLEGDFRISTPPATADEYIPVIAPAGTGNNWLNQVKRLREKGDADAALALCEQHFPRVQAFQQAALILRQQIRERVEQHRPAHDCIRELYRVAAFADLFRSNNPHKPRDPQAAWQSLSALDFDH